MAVSASLDRLFLNLYTSIDCYFFLFIVLFIWKKRKESLTRKNDMRTRWHFVEILMRSTSYGLNRLGRRVSHLDRSKCNEWLRQPVRSMRPSNLASLTSSWRSTLEPQPTRNNQSRLVLSFFFSFPRKKKSSLNLSLNVSSFVFLCQQKKRRKTL